MKTMQSYYRGYTFVNRSAIFFLFRKHFFFIFALSDK